jgi:putative restriction endonuclease
MARSRLLPLLDALPDRHRSALLWFDERAGETVPWPGSLEDGTLLATKAKGIYKPEWSRYALSVRQSMAGPYPDRAIERRPDGSWRFDYYQEGLELEAFDANFTNRGLLECLKDVVPLGVFIQVAPKPHLRYLVLGLALVAGYESGYFCLEGGDASVERVDKTSGVVPSVRADMVAEVFSPAGIEDERIRTLQLIAQRRGQSGFRRTLLDAYGRRCSITGYEAEASLEAAHIIPYRGPVTHHPSNGLLLRADMHTLFDLGLIAVDYPTRRILMKSELRSTKYREFSDHLVSFPEDERLQPSREALEWHRDRSRL